MGKSKKSKKEDTAPEQEQNRKILLVLDGNPTHDWCDIFSNIKLADGSSIHVYQASWLEVSVVYYTSSTCVASVLPIRETDGKVTRPDRVTISPDFLLIRNQPRGPTPKSDQRNVLYGFMMAGIPSFNSLFSIYCCLERPAMMAALKEIETRLGHEKFPLIPVNYYSSFNEMVIPPELPCIVKVSHAHAGMGKQKVDNSEQFRDLATILALNLDYCTAEPFIEVEYGIRVQKIGDSYRVLKKMMTGSGWKSQFGGSHLTEIPLTPEYKLWADECSKLFGGMELLAVDALHAKDGKEYIIELNDTAIGMITEHWLEESIKLAHSVANKMSQIYLPCVKKEEKLESKKESEKPEKQEKRKKSKKK